MHLKILYFGGGGGMHEFSESLKFLEHVPVCSTPEAIGLFRTLKSSYYKLFNS